MGFNTVDMNVCREKYKTYLGYESFHRLPWREEKMRDTQKTGNIFRGVSSNKGRKTELLPQFGLLAFPSVMLYS